MEKHRRTLLGIATAAAGLAVLTACGDGPAEPPPPPPTVIYALVIERTPGEIVEGDCSAAEDLMQLPLDATFEESGTRLEVDSRLQGLSAPIAWEGVIDAAGNFQIFATTWANQPGTWESWKAVGSISADRSSLTATEEFRGFPDSQQPGQGPLCHSISSWSTVAD